MSEANEIAYDMQAIVLIDKALWNFYFSTRNL